ncbi:MAG: DUF4296 domain-containing protein [Ginsengibacter sp.]
MKRGFILVLVFIIASCNKSNYIPPGIIKPIQMQNLFWDIIRGDILAQEIIKKDSTQNIKNTSFAITEKIFAVHNVDRIKFEKSIAFYEKHPLLMKTIFDSLNAIKTRKNFADVERKFTKEKNYHLPHSIKIP